jgi:hypothetical protein
MVDHDIGDRVPLEDGVYLSDNGAIVIIDNTYVGYFPHVIDKWGGLLDTGAIIWKENPVVKILAELREGDFDAIRQHPCSPEAEARPEPDDTFPHT